MNLSLLERNLKDLRSELSAAEIRLNMLNQDYEENELKIKECNETVGTLEKVAILLQKTAERQRAYVCSQIELIGTSALQYVYGTRYELKLEMNSGKKKAECELWVLETMPDGSQIKLKPQDSRGGGVLDEPGKHVSKEFSSSLSDFLITLSEQLGRQQIVITHNDFMAESAPNAIRVKRDNGVSVIERC